MTVSWSPASSWPDAGLVARCFAETPSRYLLEIEPDTLPGVRHVLEDDDLTACFGVIGTFNSSTRLTLAEASLNVAVDELDAAWRGTLDW